MIRGGRLLDRQRPLLALIAVGLAVGGGVLTEIERRRSDGLGSPPVVAWIVLALAGVALMLTVVRSAVHRRVERGPLRADNRSIPAGHATERHSPRLRRRPSRLLQHESRRAGSGADQARQELAQAADSLPCDYRRLPGLPLLDAASTAHLDRPIRLPPPGAPQLGVRTPADTRGHDRRAPARATP